MVVRSGASTIARCPSGPIKRRQEGSIAYLLGLRYRLSKMPTRKPPCRLAVVNRRAKGLPRIAGGAPGAAGARCLGGLEQAAMGGRRRPSFFRSWADQVKP